MFRVTVNVTFLKIDACGGKARDFQGSSGANGGFVSAVITVKPGTLLYIYVGGGNGNTYNGGGLGYSSGGGSTDVRSMDGGPDGSRNLTSRLFVAGGGGGGGSFGGLGGGLMLVLVARTVP
jgi:hypothetical protein